MCTTDPFPALPNKHSYGVRNHHESIRTTMIWLVSQRTNNAGPGFQRDVSLFPIKCHSTHEMELMIISVQTANPG